MPLTLVANDIEQSSLLTLTDGFASVMGEGLFIIHQIDENGEAQSLVLSSLDLKVMLAA